MRKEIAVQMRNRLRNCMNLSSNREIIIPIFFSRFKLNKTLIWTGWTKKHKDKECHKRHLSKSKTLKKSTFVISCVETDDATVYVMFLRFHDLSARLLIYLN